MFRIKKQNEFEQWCQNVWTQFIFKLSVSLNVFFVSAGDEGVIRGDGASDQITSDEFTQ